jgi:hypothetical protein
MDISARAIETLMVVRLKSGTNRRGGLPANMAISTSLERLSMP